MDLWKECAVWLSRHNVIPRDHRVLRTEATYLEFVNLIRDGVLLCKLLNKIEPGSITIDEMSLRPQLSQMLCIRNISAFLNCCKDSFGIQDEHLFEPYMLFDYSDVGKVVYMISKLSKSDKSKATKIPGFPTDYVKKKDVLLIYKTESRREDITQSVLYDKFEFYQALSEQCKIYDEIYEVIGHNTEIEAEKIYAEPSPRDYATVELYETEVVYLETLASLEKIYKVHLKKVMTPEDFEFVFQNISELHSLHSEFCQDLKEHFNSKTQISDIFLKFQNRFLIYADFCVNLKHVQDKLIQLCTNSHAIRKSVLISESIATKGKFHLLDILTVPFQRFMKYSPLIESILSNSRKSDKDYHRLQEVSSMLQDVYVHCNEATRDKENIEAVGVLEKSIINFKEIFSKSLSEYGRLLKEGSVVCRFPEVKLKGVHLLLFEQNLLFCVEEKGQVPRLSYTEGVQLVSTDIEDVSLPFKNKNSFVLIYGPTNDTQRSFTITLKTLDQKKNWMSLIHKAKASLLPHNYNFGRHLFALSTLPSGSYCNICRKLLPGLLTQGYKCNKRGCGIAVHMNCINRSDKCGLKTIASIIENVANPNAFVHLPIDQETETSHKEEWSEPNSPFKTPQASNNKLQPRYQPVHYACSPVIGIFPELRNKKPSVKVSPIMVSIESDNSVSSSEGPSFEDSFSEANQIPYEPLHNGSPTEREESRKTRMGIAVLPHFPAGRARSCEQFITPSPDFPQEEAVEFARIPPKLPPKPPSLQEAQLNIRDSPRAAAKPLSQILSLPTRPDMLQSNTPPKSVLEEFKKKKFGVPVFPTSCQNDSPAFLRNLKKSSEKTNNDCSPTFLGNPEKSPGNFGKDYSPAFLGNTQKSLGKTNKDDAPTFSRNLEKSPGNIDQIRQREVVVVRPQVDVRSQLLTDPSNQVGFVSGRFSKSPHASPFNVNTLKPDTSPRANLDGSLESKFGGKLNEQLKKFHEERSTFKSPEGNKRNPDENLIIMEDKVERNEIKKSCNEFGLADPSNEGIEIYEAVNVKFLDACIPGYVGKMDSVAASRLLMSSPEGTFLVRERQGEYAVSLRFKGSVRHVKIYTLENGQVCFAAIKKFDTVQALISFYRQHSLTELYNNLETRLVEPYSSG